MEDAMVDRKAEGNGRMAKMSVEVRLLYAACLCFILAQYVVNEHPWNSGFRMVALLALIAAQWIGFRARRKTKWSCECVGVVAG